MRVSRHFLLIMCKGINIKIQSVGLICVFANIITKKLTSTIGFTQTVYLDLTNFTKNSGMLKIPANRYWNFNYSNSGSADIDDTFGNPDIIVDNRLIINKSGDIVGNINSPAPALAKGTYSTSKAVNIESTSVTIDNTTGNIVS